MRIVFSCEFRNKEKEEKIDKTKPGVALKYTQYKRKRARGVQLASVIKAGAACPLEPGTAGASKLHGIHT
jgi:hypothetical protein